MQWIRAAICTAGLLGGLLFSPILPAVGILLLSLRWRAFEALFLGVLMDLLYLPPSHVPLFTLGAIATVWLLEPIRNEFLT